MSQFRTEKSLKCHSCYNAKARQEINTNSEKFFKRLLSTAQGTAKRRAKTGRAEAGECTITLDDIKDKYIEQDGKCYYSKIKLVLRTYADWQCSLERLDQSKGYTKDNIALIISELQIATQWSHAKFDVFLTLINTVHYAQPEIDWYPARAERRSTQKTEYSVVNGIKHCLCKMCDINQPVENYAKGEHCAGCKSCKAERAKRYYTTPVGHMRLVSKTMRGNAKRKARSITCDLTYADIVSLYDKQKGLCYYSGIKMNFGPYLEQWWTVSPERLDAAKGYVADNVVLICYEFNTADSTSKAVSSEEITGSMSWNAHKMDVCKQLKK